MRRLTVIFVVGCAALGLGLGLFLNSRNPGSSQTAGRSTVTSTTFRVFGTTSTTLAVAGVTVTRPPAPVVTTTTRPAPTTTTTAKKTAATTKPKSTVTTQRQTTGTTGFDTVDCGGSTTTSVTVNYPAVGPSTGRVTVDNSQNSKTIVIDTLIVHMHHADGTSEDISVPDAQGSTVGSSASRGYDFDPGNKVADQQPTITITYHVEGHPECHSA